MKANELRGRAELAVGGRIRVSKRVESSDTRGNAQGSAQ